MEPRELLHCIGTASSSVELVSLLDHPDAEESHVLALLRKRHLSALVLETLSRHERWGTRRSVRAAIVSHPMTPRTVSLRLLGLLFWSELLRVALNHRLAMPLRAAAERTLRDRLPELELGERVTLGRLAPLLLLRTLLDEEPHPRVVASLLLNPRLPEADVLALVESPDTPPETLRLISESSRFGARRAVKLGLIKNPRTPAHVALRALVGLPRSALSGIASQTELPPLLRLGAERLLSGERPAEPG